MPSASPTHHMANKRRRVSARQQETPAHTTSASSGEHQSPVSLLDLPPDVLCFCVLPHLGAKDLACFGLSSKGAACLEQTAVRVVVVGLLNPNNELPQRQCGCQ